MGIEGKDGFILPAAKINFDHTFMCMLYFPGGEGHEARDLRQPRLRAPLREEVSLLFFPHLSNLNWVVRPRRTKTLVELTGWRAYFMKIKYYNKSLN